MAVAVGDPVILARLPGYRVTTTKVTADSGALTSEAVIATVVGSLISGVKYRVVFDGHFQETGAANTGVRVQIREDSISGTVQGAGQCSIENGLANGNDLASLRVYAEYTAVSTASKTFVATGLSANAVMNAGTTFPSWLYIEVVE